MNSENKPLTPVSPQQAEFIETKTKQLFDYTIECLDRARTDGNNVLQWLFGVITGGLAIIGAVWTKEYYVLAVGFAFSVGAAAYAATKLVPALSSRETMPPGNTAAALNVMLDDTPERMRWREAKNMDDRIEKNRTAVQSITTAVDNARVRLARIPAWFLGGLALASLAKVTFQL